jgi:hypothetical protein
MVQASHSFYRCESQEMKPQRLYVDGAPCTNGCGRTYRRSLKTSKGRCSWCHYLAKPDRAERHAKKAERHPATVLLWELRREMDAAGKAGLCIYCERLLTPPRLLICPSEDCQRLYNSDWKRGERMLKRQARAA